MQYFQGKSVYKGIVMGPVAVLKKNDYQVKRARIEDPEAEVKRVDEALKASQEQLQKLYDKAVREVGEASAAIFEVHQMMLEDLDFNEAIENVIRTQEVNAEYAVASTGDSFSEMFASMDDDYMKARAVDIKDISERLVQNLAGNGDNGLDFTEPVIVVADDLTPSETVQMDKEKILAKTEKNQEKIFALQDKLYADAKEGLIIILQARDAAGKDSTIRHVMGCLLYTSDAADE